jgi:FLYWCH zinc finger domain
MYNEQPLEVPEQKMAPSLIPSPSKLRRHDIEVVVTGNGSTQLYHSGYRFVKNNATYTNTYWRCIHARALSCRARIVTSATSVRVTFSEHTHPAMERLNYGLGVANYKR